MAPLSGKFISPNIVERDLVIGMIVSGRFLKRIRPHWDPSWHESKLSRTVAGWCVEHWDKYKKEPGKEIETRWSDWADRPDTDPSEVELVERMLTLASKEYERDPSQFNDDYLLDRVEKWARGRVLRELADDLDAADHTGDVEWAAERAQGIILPRIGGRRSWADPADKEAMKLAFERTYQPLFEIPGAFGKLVNPQIYREGFVAWMAPEKRGKTQLLLEMAYWALRYRCRTAFFAIGDMSEDELRLRWASRIAKKSDRKMGWKQALKAVREFERDRSAKGFLRFQAWPNFTAGCADLERELDAWEVEGWVADVVIVDYADNLVPTNRDDYRHRVNVVWQGLRKISQERRCLLLTATQSDANSYEKSEIGLGNFSEDKRKYGHVTAIGAIDQDEFEKKKGQIRLKWLLVRRGRSFGEVCLQGDWERGLILKGQYSSWYRRNKSEDDDEDDD